MSIGNTIISLASTVDIDDQSASKYVDIGNMRIQWGNVTGVIGTQTITFPAPFADANYTIVGGSRGVLTASGDLTLQSTNYTTTTFDGLLQFHDAALNAIQNASDDWQWIAIGLKP